MDRRNFFMAAMATIAGLLFAPKAKAASVPVCPPFGDEAHAPYQRRDGQTSIVINPTYSQRLLYLDSGDFLRPGEWFAVPRGHVSWIEYDVPSSVCA